MLVPMLFSMLVPMPAPMLIQHCTGVPRLECETEDVRDGSMLHFQVPPLRSLQRLLHGVELLRLENVATQRSCHRRPIHPVGHQHLAPEYGICCRQGNDFPFGVDHYPLKVQSSLIIMKWPQIVAKKMWCPVLLRLNSLLESLMNRLENAQFGAPFAWPHTLP